MDDISLVDCTPSLILETPNVFTPNGDGDNDNYYITLENVESAQITIFNRWGNAVYTTTNTNFVWDGTQNGNALAEGVYYIVVNAKGLDGEEVIEKQTVHLVRWVWDLQRAVKIRFDYLTTPSLCDTPSNIEGEWTFDLVV